MSEFGRDAAENSSAGTDHGTAAAHMLLSGGVNCGFYSDASFKSCFCEDWTTAWYPLCKWERSSHHIAVETHNGSSIVDTW
jgi:hypothetical protein